MQDFLGRPIQIGSYVATFEQRYRRMMMARVIKITPKKIVIKYNNTWNFSNPNGSWETHTMYPSELLVLTDEYALQKIMMNPISLEK